MHSNTAVKVQQQASEETQSESRLGTGTIMMSLLIMTMVFSIVWFGLFNPFMA
ncbi:hypothetical protein [Alicyclobacillus sp. SO9]|uniref:hypothetical protein n=1 Tax=Alicyclobacillus sp. SO9 TaxID=2665646 RepID=UPI0018E76DA1|nr:hypothetical protein [Alicyclobacillus sp. SO9]QQE77795.1 hypothetical protein GI364_17975 [Alicyclobacillus sp. SO9]